MTTFMEVLDKVSMALIAVVGIGSVALGAIALLMQ